MRFILLSLPEGRSSTEKKCAALACTYEKILSGSEVARPEQIMARIVQRYTLMLNNSERYTVETSESKLRQIAVAFLPVEIHLNFC